MGTLVFNDYGDKIILRLPYPFRAISLFGALAMALGIIWQINSTFLVLYILLLLAFLGAGLYRESFTFTKDTVTYKIGWAFIVKTIVYKVEDIEKLTLDSFYKGYQSGFVPPKDNPKKIFKKKYTKFTRLELHLLDGEVKVVELIKDNKVYQLENKISRINVLMGK